MGRESEEIQIKIKGKVSGDYLLSLGAQEVGSTQQRDIYYSRSGRVLKNEEIVRVRKENDQSYNIITVRTITHHGKIIIRKFKSYIKSDKETKEFLSAKDLKIIGEVIKDRIVYVLGDFIIRQDTIHQNLGEFVEIVSKKVKDEFSLLNLAKRLNLDIAKAEKRTYIDMISAIQGNNWIRKFLYILADKLQVIVRPMSSAIVTTLSVIIGIWFGAKDMKILVASIITIALSDSFSDANGEYNSERMRPLSDERKAFRRGVIVFITKILTSLSFLLPFLFFKNKSPIFLIFIDFLWAFLLLCFLGLEVAIFQYLKVKETIFRYLLIAFGISVMAFIGGKIATFLSNMYFI